MSTYIYASDQRTGTVNDSTLSKSTIVRVQIVISSQDSEPLPKNMYVYSEHWHIYHWAVTQNQLQPVIAEANYRIPEKSFIYQYSSTTEMGDSTIHCSVCRRPHSNFSLERRNSRRTVLKNALETIDDGSDGRGREHANHILILSSTTLAHWHSKSWQPYNDINWQPYGRLNWVCDCILKRR